MTRFSIATFFILPLLAACGDHHNEAGFDDGCAEPTYGGKGTDEAWKTMVDAYDAAEVGAAEAVTVTSPDDTIAANGAPPTLAWTSPIASGQVRPRSFALAPRVEADTLLDDALAAIGGFFVGTARAHLPPITGDVYFVELSVAGLDCPVARGLTTDESWTLSAAEWEAVKAHVGVPIQMDVTSAYLTENRVTEGPYRPTASTVFELE